jgi:ketosteroid isomerase-like protein
MKIAFRLVLLAAVAGLGFWLWTIFFPASEKVVLKKIASLAATATFSANDSNFTRAGKAGNLVSFFAPDAQIIFDAPGLAARTFSGRDEIREAAYGGFASLPALKVQFLDVTVRIGTDKQTADVNCTARVTAGDSKDYGVQEMHFQLKKVDGSWLISRAETVKTLS